MHKSIEKKKSVTIEKMAIISYNIDQIGGKKMVVKRQTRFILVKIKN